MSNWYVLGNAAYNLSCLFSINLLQYRGQDCDDWYIELTTESGNQCTIKRFKSCDQEEAFNTYQNILKCLRNKGKDQCD